MHFGGLVGQDPKQDDVTRKYRPSTPAHARNEPLRVCRRLHSLRRWVRQAERDKGLRAGLTSDERERMKAMEREIRELRQANEILRKASAYFAVAELDRRSKP
jgi:hypothetical protein